MLPVYIVLMVIAIALSTVTLIPAICLAGVAAVLVVRYELLLVGQKLAAIKVPRPRLETTTVKAAVPADDALAG